MRQTTRHIRTVLAVTVGLLGHHLAPADGAVWEVRRAHVADQKDEWTAMGRIPAWEVRVGEGDSPAIAITGDEPTGQFRGTVLVGRRWLAPAALPPDVRVRLEYQTYCAMNDPAMLRSGMALLAIFTPQRWEEFAADPERAEIWNLRADSEGEVAMYPIHNQGEDVTEWRTWRSRNLAPKLRRYAGHELVIAVVWAAMHFCEEWAKFRGVEIEMMSEAEVEREFLEAFDLSLPELTEVKAALERADLEAAKSALVQHMRTREMPVGPELSPDGSARGIEAADDIVAHVFRLVGCPPTKLEGDIRWNEDPHNYDQWAIALNRHQHWVTLGRAYAATRNETYAREFVAQLNGWVSSMPVYIGPRWIQGPFFEAGKNPLTLDAGIRMAHTWWPAYYYFKDSPSFDVASQVRMLRSFRDHAVYLMEPAHFKPGSNWGAMEVNGLFHIAVMLPEFTDAAAWLATARERLVEAQKAQVYPDGAQIELTTGYHGVTLGNFLGVLEVARRNDIELSPEFVSGLERMFEYYVALAMPDGRLPALNDAGWGSARGMLARGLKLFPERHDFEYVSSGCRRGSPPDRTSWRLPYAGWNVMRTGWEPDDKYLLFENGPFGAGHQHEDKLNVVVHAGRRTILTEGGNYAYDASDWRRYVLSTRAHNTVMVDGLDQRRATRRETFVVWQPQETRWISNDGFDFAEGIYDSGYGRDNEIDVVHIRQVVFFRPDYWVVLDTMRPPGNEKHSYEAMFHIDADDVTVDAETQSVTASYDGGGLRIIPFGHRVPDVQIVKGQTEPTVQGWLPTGRHNELRPIPTAVFRWEAQGASVAGFALVPRGRDEDWPVHAVTKAITETDSGLVAMFDLPGGRRDVIVRGKSGSMVSAPALLATDADVAAVRFDSDGGPAKVLQVGGTELRVIPLGAK